MAAVGQNKNGGVHEKGEKEKMDQKRGVTLLFRSGLPPLGEKNLKGGKRGTRSK